ncbi:hypothetical protein Ancab_000855 [Ancistrocladus abbreviatus]
MVLSPSVVAFNSNVFTALSINCNYISKVGSDFNYCISSPLIVSSSSKTTLSTPLSSEYSEGKHTLDQVLKRVHACDSIGANDLPTQSGNFDFGMLGLIREFNERDGTVRLMRLKENGFYDMVPRIRLMTR